MRTSIRPILATVALVLLARPAVAQSLPPLPLVAIDVPAAPDTADPAAATDVAAPAPDAFGPAVAGDALDDLRGGTDTTTVTNVSHVDGTVDGNTAINAITGGNLMDGGAFGNAAGLSTVIQNSGNNVLIQNSTVVSVMFSPTP